MRKTEIQDRLTFTSQRVVDLLATVKDIKAAINLANILYESRLVTGDYVEVKSTNSENAAVAALTIEELKITRTIRCFDDMPPHLESKTVITTRPIAVLVLASTTKVMYQHFYQAVEHKGFIIVVGDHSAISKELDDVELRLITPSLVAWQKMEPKVTLIDITIFGGEKEMLLLRLAELSRLVQRFYIVEADFTFTGIKRELVFHETMAWIAANTPPEAKEVLDKIAERIVYIPITTYTDCKNAWERECYIRSYPLARVKADYIDNPLVVAMCCDLDEIPNVDAITHYISTYPYNMKVTALQMSLHYYALRWISTATWDFPIIANIRAIKTIQSARNNGTAALTNAGCHLSYFMTREEIRKKLLSFSHVEYNTEEFTCDENIDNALAHGCDLFKRGFNFKPTPAGVMKPKYHWLLPKHCQ